MAQSDVEITYTVGSEHSPTDPFGRATLSIRGDAVSLEVRKAGRPPLTAEGSLRAGAMTELAKAIFAASRDVVTARPLRPDEAVAVIDTRLGGRTARSSCPYHDAVKLPGWGAALTLLDGIAHALAPDRTTTPTRPGGAELLARATPAIAPLVPAPAPARAAGIPVTWRALIDAEAASAQRGLGYLLSDAKEMQAVRAGLASIARELERPADVLVRGALLVGLAGTGPARRAFDPFVPAALDEVARGVRDVRGASAASGLCAYLHVQALLGPPAPPFAPVEALLLPQIAPYARELEDIPRRRFALACVAAGLPTLVAHVAGPQALAAPFEPGACFGPNTVGFAAHVARAQLARASPETVRPAFDELWAYFPRLVAAQSLDWLGLSYAARAFHATLEGRPLDDVLGALIQRARSA